MGRTVDCICSKGQEPWCPACVVSAAIQMRHEHQESLSTSMLQRRVPKLEGYVAAILVEMTKRMPPPRNGRYVA